MAPSRFSFQRRPGSENYAPLHQDVFIFFVQVSPKPMSVHWKGETRNLTCLRYNNVLVTFHPLLSRPKCNREWNVQRSEVTTLRTLRRRSTRSRRSLSITSHLTRSVKSKHGFQRPVWTTRPLLKVTLTLRRLSARLFCQIGMCLTYRVER
jgi:hypothetical protein